MSKLLHRYPIPMAAPEGAGGAGGSEDPTGGGNPASGTDGNDSKNGGNSEPKTFEDLLKSNQDYQAALDRKINKAVETAISNERARQQVIQDGLQDEVLRVSKMTQAEKEAYFKNKAEKEAADREAKLLERELRLDARTALQDKHLPESFIDLLVYKDKESMLKSVATIDAAFRTAVQAAVDDKLKGQPAPKDAKTEGTPPGTNTEQDKVLAEAAKIAGIRLK